MLINFTELSGGLIMEQGQRSIFLVILIVGGFLGLLLAGSKVSRTEKENVRIIKCTRKGFLYFICVILQKYRNKNRRDQCPVCFTD